MFQLNKACVALASIVSMRLIKLGSTNQQHNELRMNRNLFSRERDTGTLIHALRIV